MRFHQIFVEEQDNDKFREICNLFVIKKDNKIKEIYIPYFVTKKMNMINFEEKKIEINMERDETYDGFMGFLDDFITGNKNIDFVKEIDLEKYSISKKFLDNYYNIIPLSMKKTYYNLITTNYRGERLDRKSTRLNSSH